MATCQEIIQGAVLELGARPLGDVIGPEEADRGLTVLNAMYREAVRKGYFGRVVDYIASANYTAREQQRVFSAGFTITLPTSVQNYENNDYGWCGCPTDDYGFDSQNSRRPKDLAMIQVVNTGSAAQISIYDAEIATWVRIDALKLTDVAPFSEHDQHGLECALARKLASSFQRQVPDTTAAYANGLASVLSERLSAGATVTNAQFF